MLTGLADPDAILDFYLRLGPRIVALKMGADGAILATAEQRLRIPAFACRPVDGTGAGDTFCGSFLARLSAGTRPKTRLATPPARRPCPPKGSAPWHRSRAPNGFVARSRAARSSVLCPGRNRRPGRGEIGADQRGDALKALSSIA